MHNTSVGQLENPGAEELVLLVCGIFALPCSCTCNNNNEHMQTGLSFDKLKVSWD